MHVSVHIYKHLAFFFFICCKVLSPFFILTLLDHVVLVSSASTTNTREIKNRFRLERLSPSRSTKIVNTNKRLDFFGFSHVFFDILFMIFCLLFFFTFLDWNFLISIRKSTITYIQYINVSIVSFVCCFYTQYLYILSGGASRSTGADCDRALQILGYGFHLRHTVLKVHRQTTQIVYFISFFLLFIGSTKIVSHFLRNFVARSVFRRPLRWPKLCVRVFPSVRAPKNVVRCQTLRTNKRCFFLIVIKWVCFFF